LEPGGKVSNIPGLKTKNKVVVTMRSVLVRTRPIAFAIIEYTRKNTRAWNKTAVRPVRPLRNLMLVPSVLRMIPGLSARKRAAGMATFWEVISGSMFILYHIIILWLYHLKNGNKIR